jgi:hypothetical protein
MAASTASGLHDESVQLRGASSAFAGNRHRDGQAQQDQLASVGYYEGALPYLGRHYDMQLDGASTRVLVVPMEVGAKWRRKTSVRSHNSRPKQDVRLVCPRR